MSLLLLHASPRGGGRAVRERLGETILGVGLAFVVGLGLPAWTRRRTAGAAA